MVLAGAFGTWYWTARKIDVPFFTVASVALRTVTYHIGTVALGSIVITIGRLIRFILGMGKSGRNCGLFMCLQWTCVCGIDQFLQRLNQNAYIMSAIHGKTLFASATQAYQLIKRNSLRYVATDIITWLVFFVCKLTLACYTGVIAYFYYMGNGSLYSVLPVLSLALGSYYLFGAVLNVFSAAIDTMVLCARKYRCINYPYLI